MALAMQPKKKLKNRSTRRSASTRAFEEEDEDMAIISRLEKEPWQPDLLLERQSDKTSSPNPFLSSSSSTTTTTAAAIPNNINGATVTTTTNSGLDEPSTNSESTTVGGFQGVIPVIIKSPSSVITTADSDCVESIFEDHSSKISGIQEYLQQTHQEQLLLQQQRLQRQQDVQLQLQYQLPAHLVHQNKINNGNATAANNAATINNSSSSAYINSTDNNTKRQTSQQYRNSFHGHSAPFLGLDEYQSIHEPQARSESPLSKVVNDNEDVIESLQSLKNLAMLALDGLLQQVVSDVTASDPVYNADETTLQARAIIRRKSLPLLQLEEGAQDHSDNQGGLRTPEHEQEQQSLSYLKGDSQPQEALTRRTTARMSLSGMPIAGMATSSLERLDELARKVDQLTVVTNTADISNSSSSLFREQNILHEPLDIPNNSSRGPSTLSSSSHHRRQQNEPRQRAHYQLASPSQLHPSQIFESQEYQLACALAALLACIYRILNTMQEPRLPIRTESADSGLDQASRLWKRLSSNSFARNPLRASQNNQSNLREHLNNGDSNHVGSSLPWSPEKKALTHSESATGGFIQSINRQVRIMKSRRTQSTSQIEVQKTTYSDLGKRPVRSIGGSNLHPENAAQSEKTKNLEREWDELDKLMDEMSFLWQAVGSLEDEQVGVDIGSQSDEERDHGDVTVTNPFDDSHATRQQQRTSIISAWTPMTPAPDFDQQTLDMAVLDDLPQYDDVTPQYRTYEKSDQATTPADDSHAKGGMMRVANRSSRSNMSSGLDDEKTRFDLNNVMGAIERLSRVAPRMDNQRVQMSPTQKKQMAQANVSSTIDQISRHQWGERAGSSSSSAARRQTAVVDPLLAEKSRDLNKLMNQISESAKAGFTTQRVELSPRQQWKLEGARISDKIERGEKMRLTDQDWQSPESVLIKDMTRLTNALYQQTASTEAFETQRYTMTEDKARNMALQGILSKIERVSSRRMGNQDALPPTTKSKPNSASSSSSSSKNKHEEESSKARELQEMIDQVVESGGGPKRRFAMASQRAEFNPPVPRS